MSLQSVSAAQQFPTTIMERTALFSFGNSRPASLNLAKVQLSIPSVSAMSKARQGNVGGRFKKIFG